MSYVKANVEGPCLLVQGKLDGKEIVIVNSYGPNIDEEEFYPRVQGLMTMDTGCPLIWVDYKLCVGWSQGQIPSKI